jgi:hypothetical protein
MFSNFRNYVFVPKPLQERHENKPENKVFSYFKTRNSRQVTGNDGVNVRCKLNRVAPCIQAVLAFLCTYWLDQQRRLGNSKGSEGCEGCEGATQQHPMLTFARMLIDHCAYGVLHTAKSNEKYAALMEMRQEYVRDWANKHNSQYISNNIEVNHSSFLALIAFFRNSQNPCEYTDEENEKIVDGFVSLCALPDSYFGACFDSYGGDKEAFFIFLVGKIQDVVEEMWCKKRHDMPLQLYNLGIGKDIYYNIRESFFNPLE